MHTRHEWVLASDMWSGMLDGLPVSLWIVFKEISFSKPPGRKKLKLQQTERFKLVMKINA